MRQWWKWVRRAEKEASAASGGGGPLLYAEVGVDDEAGREEEVEEAVEARDEVERGEEREETAGEVVDGVDRDSGEDAVAVGERGEEARGEGEAAAEPAVSGSTVSGLLSVVRLLGCAALSGSSEAAAGAVLLAVCRARPLTCSTRGVMSSTRSVVSTVESSSESL